MLDPGNALCGNARRFFRDNPDQAKRFPPEDLGLDLVPADKVYAWVEPDKAFADAALHKKWVFLYAYWPR